MKTLYNPFEIYSEKKLLIAGILFTILGSFLAIMFNGRYDGMLDFHFYPVDRYEPFTDNLLAIGCSVLVFFCLGKIINKKTRFIDMLTTSIIARFPLYLLPFFNINNVMIETSDEILNMVSAGNESNFETSNIFLLGVFSMILILCIIWFFILLWNGFRIATNAKGMKHILFFVLAIIIGEVISKVLFSVIYIS